MNTRSEEEGALEDEEDADKMKNRRSEDARVRVRVSRLTYATGA
jgi:hypothetical protein